MNNTIPIGVIGQQFFREFQVMNYASLYGIGIGDPGNTELGLTVYFSTQEDMDRFPFKGSIYQGVLVYKRVIGPVLPA